MDFYTLIQNRESIREYDPDRKVPEEVLKRILNAGRLAPSAANRQPWEFIIVTSEEALKKVRPCYPSGWFHDAPHILIVKGSKDKAWKRRYDNYNALETDLTIAMDHMILAAEHEGLGTCWVAAFDPCILYQAIGLSPEEIVYAITPIGYMPEGFKKKEHKIRKDLGEVSSFI